jgi:hypothetical protein
MQWSEAEFNDRVIAPEIPYCGYQPLRYREDEGPWSVRVTLEYPAWKALGVLIINYHSTEPRLIGVCSRFLMSGVGVKAGRLDYINAADANRPSLGYSGIGRVTEGVEWRSCLADWNSRYPQKCTYPNRLNDSQKFVKSVVSHYTWHNGHTFPCT